MITKKMPIIKLKPHGKKLRQRFRVPEEVVSLFGREFIHFSTPKQDRIAAEAECAEWLAVHWAEFARLKQAPSKIQAVIEPYLKDVTVGEALSEKAREGLNYSTSSSQISAASTRQSGGIGGGVTFGALRRLRMHA